MKPPANHQNSSPDRHEMAVYWLVRLSVENCSDDEKREFAAWLAQDPKNQEVYEQAQAQWQAMEAFKKQRFPAREAALRYRAAKKQPQRYFQLATAASVLLALGLTAFGAKGWLGSWNTYTTEKGQHSNIVLADGSRVELNTDTQLQVHFNRWHRHVELVHGEAFFTVVHNAERPFTVTAGAGLIEDIGTQFEVFLQPDQVLVAVEEGEVAVEAEQRKDLVAGQQTAYSETGEFLKPAKQEISTLTAWRQGQLRFNNRRLDQVLAELARYHDIKIRVANSKLAKLPVTGVFKTNNLQGIMNAIALTLPVTGRYENANSIVLELRD